jgi:hypothetical protein
VFRVDAMGGVLTVGAIVALAASVIVTINLPSHVGTSEEQGRYGGHGVCDDDSGPRP